MRSNTYNVGVTPSSIAVTPNQRFAYVTNSNNYRIPNSDSVTVLNLTRASVETTIQDPSFNEPYRIAIDKQGKKAYVCNSGSTIVSIIDVATNRVTGTISGFDGPSGIVLTKTKAYVINYGAGENSGKGKTVSVVSLKLNQILATITVDQAPAALILSPNERSLYVVCYVDGKRGNGTLNVIATRENKVVAKMNGLFGPFGITLLGNRAWITEFGSNDFAPYGTSVAIIRLATLEITKRIETGIQPAAIVSSPDSKYVYVSNYNALYQSPVDFKNLTYGEGTIQVIRADGKILLTIPIGQSPSGLALVSNNSNPNRIIWKLLVTKYAQNTVNELKVSFIQK